jgi:hypothetical protein
MAESYTVFVRSLMFQHAAHGGTSPAPKTSILVPGMQTTKDKVRSKRSVLTLCLCRDPVCAQDLSRRARDLQPGAARSKQYVGLAAASSPVPLPSHTQSRQSNIQRLIREGSRASTRSLGPASHRRRRLRLPYTDIRVRVSSSESKPLLSRSRSLCFFMLAPRRNIAIYVKPSTHYCLRNFNCIYLIVVRQYGLNVYAKECN